MRKRRKLRVGSSFFVAMFVAAICSLSILFITYQEEVVDSACIAIEAHDQESAKIHIDKVWDIDTVGLNNKTMLMSACESGNGEMIEYLLMRGANVNKTVRGYLTPLELFCSSGYEAGDDVLITLLNCGARQSIYTEKPAIFHLAEQFYWMNSKQKNVATEETVTLLQYGAPMIYQKTSLLHYAAQGNMSDLFYTIVHTTNGLYMLNMKDENDNTPWSVAVQNGSVSVQQVIRNLEKEYEDEQKENGTVQPEETIPPSGDDAPLGSIENPYPDGFFDEDGDADEQPTDATISAEDLENWYQNGQ